jgi:hypothetical protein
VQIFLGAAVLLASLACRADTIYLKNGLIVTVEQACEEGDRVTYSIDSANYSIPKSEVSGIIPNNLVETMANRPACASPAELPPRALEPSRAVISKKDEKPSIEFSAHPGGPSKTTILWANIALWGSAGLLAHSTAYGSHTCLAEDIKAGHPEIYLTVGYGGGRRHPYRDSFLGTVPVDAGVSALSYFLLRKKHRMAAFLAPALGASGQSGAAIMQYVAGCF